MFELVNTVNAAVIKVIGVGGGGGNAVEHMLKASLEGVEFICANTDAQALKNSTARNILQLGNGITQGLGAGADPEIGRQSALEDRDRLADALEGSDMLFITAGMGGGTGTGASPVVAQVAKEMGVLTVAVVTRPFVFEGKKRAEAADNGIRDLSKSVDSLITVPNEKLLSVLGPDTSLLDAFGAANDILLGAVRGIADLITRTGLMNVDFADVRTVMEETGMAMMGSGKAQGEDRARVAAEAAISSPLLEDVNLTGAKGILVNITGGKDLSTGELDEVGKTIEKIASESSRTIIGTVIDPDVSGEIRVTLIATGLGRAIVADDAPRISQLTGGIGSMDCVELERPTVMRQKDVNPGMNSARDDPAYLDIPAFLRRQAD